MSGEDRRERDRLSTKEELLEKLEHIKTLSCLLSRLLEKAERSVQQSLEGFVSDEVRQLGSAIGGYFKCFDAFNVKTRTALEAKWSECYQCQEIRDTVEYLLEVEENWNAFLEKVDCMLNGGAVNEVKVTAGAGAPCEVPLIDVTTNSIITLGDMIGEKSLLLVLLRHFA